ncbi:MAG: putative ABC transport system permease protein [Alteromonadaceae bacterium]|jgi:putative ABC transport system permease protein
MFSYYLKIAWFSILRHWGLSILMISAIGLGIGAAMTTITVNYLMSANPIPHKSNQLYYVQLDSWDVNTPFDEDKNPPDHMTYTDATNLMKAKKAFRQSIHVQATTVIESNDPDQLPFTAEGMANSADFFAMFDVPFIYGGGWSEQTDNNKELVVVLNKATNDRLFAGKNSVTKTVKIDGHLFKVLGVIDVWEPKPRYYDVIGGAFNKSADIFVPFSLIAEEIITKSGSVRCWKSYGDGLANYLASECTWTNFWIELKTKQDKQDYLTFLNAYVEQQKQYGRLLRPLNNRLSNVMQWLESQEVVTNDNKMILAMSLMFFIVCLLNTVGLLLAKFLGKSQEIGLRQALGASKATLFAQYIIESACIGLAGGLLGIILAYLGLKSVESLYGDEMQGLASLDLSMITLAITMSLVATVLAGLYPTWKACNIQPALQLKSQ